MPAFIVFADNTFFSHIQLIVYQPCATQAPPRPMHSKARERVNYFGLLPTIQLSREHHRANVGDSGNCESVKNCFSWGSRKKV